jgi:hypothetical protein
LVKPSTAEQAPETHPGQGPGIGGVSVDKIDIRKADITWNDQKNGAHYAVHNLDFKTGKIVTSQPVDVQLSFDLESGQPPLRTRVDLKSRMSLDLEAQTLNVDSLTLALGDLALQTNFKGTHIFDAPAVTGALEISPFNPRALMDKLGIKVETSGKTALTKLSLKTKFSATTDGAELKDLTIQLDASRLTGSLGVHHFARPSYQFDLTLDQIDRTVISRRRRQPPLPLQTGVDHFRPAGGGAVVGAACASRAGQVPHPATQGDESAFERRADTGYGGQRPDHARSQSGQALQRKIRRPHHARRARQGPDARHR